MTELILCIQLTVAPSDDVIGRIVTNTGSKAKLEALGVEISHLLPGESYVNLLGTHGDLDDVTFGEAF